MQYAYSLVKRRQRFRFRVIFLQSILQDLQIVVIATNQWSFTIRTDRAFGKIPGRHAGNKTATAALQSPGDTIPHWFFGNLEPNREIEWSAVSGENRRQAFV